MADDPRCSAVIWPSHASGWGQCPGHILRGHCTAYGSQHDTANAQPPVDILNPRRPAPLSSEPDVLGVTEAMLRNVATAAHQARTAPRRPPLSWELGQPGAAVRMPCTIHPVFEDVPRPPIAELVARAQSLLLRDQADAARTTPGPLCHEQLPVEDDPTAPVLLCDLPAGHHSEEHYDRASGTVWLPPGVEPRTRPGLDRPDPG